MPVLENRAAQGDITAPGPWGVIFGVGAATVWVSYGVAQKVLLRRL